MPQAQILVTGGAGYIGSALTQRLLQEGYGVRCYDSRPPSPAMLPFFQLPRYEFVRGDILDSEKLKGSLAGVDAIVHLAAIVGYPACQRSSRLAWLVNVEGARTLASARSPGQIIVFASTGSNYGAVTDGICTEEQPLNPLSEYGRTKTEAERVLMDSGNVITYRLATAFGLSPRPRFDLLVNDFCYQAVRSGSLVVYEGHFLRTFLHVADIAMAIEHALRHSSEMKDQMYNCGDERLNMTKLEVAQCVQRITGVRLHASGDGHDLDERNYRVSYEKIRATGFAASMTVEDGVHEMVRAFRALDDSA